MVILTTKSPDYLKWFSCVEAHALSVWGCVVTPATERQAFPFLSLLQVAALGFVQANISTDNVIVLLVAGDSCSNGHAFNMGPVTLVWISVTQYATELSKRIFVTHELLHGLHYQRSPLFAPDTQEQKNHVGRQLVTEGLITWCTQQFLGVRAPVALWADILQPDVLLDVMNRYTVQEDQTARQILRDWDRTDSTFFYANDPTNVDAYRSGYALGRHLFERIAEKEQSHWQQLLRIDRKALEAQVQSELRAVVKEAKG